MRAGCDARPAVCCDAVGANYCFRVLVVGQSASHSTNDQRGKPMRRLVTAALTCACLVSSSVLLSAEEVKPRDSEYKRIGVHEYATSGGKCYIRTTQGVGRPCSPDEVKEMEAAKQREVDAKAKVAICIKACSDAARKCFDAEKAANLRPSEVKKDAPKCGLIETQCDQRC